MKFLKTVIMNRADSWVWHDIWCGVAPLTENDIATHHLLLKSDVKVLTY